LFFMLTEPDHLPEHHNRALEGMAA